LWYNFRQNINIVTDSLTQTKLEFPHDPTQEENNTQIQSQSILQPNSSVIIENAFSTLPLPISQVLTKTSLCTICKKHFISEDWLNKHIQKDHAETPSQTQKPIDPQTETLNQSSKPSFVETFLRNANIKPVITTLFQQRYSLRERKSTAKSIKQEDIDSDNDNDKEYTVQKSFSSSHSSDSEEDVNKVIKPSSKPDLVSKSETKPKISHIIRYANCEICNKKTTTKFLKRHLKSWHDTTGLDDNQIIKCTSQSCTAYFINKEQLQHHKRYEHERMFRCHICKKAFKEKHDRNHHLRYDHGTPRSYPLKYDDKKFISKEFKCNFCTFVSTSPTKLAIHETEHALHLPDDISNRKLQRCPRCPYQYTKKRQRLYVVHHLRHHLSYLTGESSAACEMCSKGKVFVANTRTHFDRHHNTDLLEGPTKVYKCDECPSFYLKPFQLHRHKISIHPTKTCKICAKTFNLRQTLLVHMTTMHKEEESNPAHPVPCDWPNCVKRFGTEAELEFHKIYGHKRNPEEKKGSVICEICGRGFRSTGLLRVHKTKTHVEKTFVCGDCGKMFKAKVNLEKHMEFHKGPESWKFECKECGKKCIDKHKLAGHMNTHTKEKPFICQFCGEKYAHRHNWRNHLKGKHMNEEGVDEIVNSKASQRKGNYLSRKGTKKGDCIMASAVK